MVPALLLLVVTDFAAVDLDWAGQVAVGTVGQLAIMADTVGQQHAQGFLTTLGGRCIQPW